MTPERSFFPILGKNLFRPVETGQVTENSEERQEQSLNHTDVWGVR